MRSLDVNEMRLRNDQRLSRVAGSLRGQRGRVPHQLAAQTGGDARQQAAHDATALPGGRGAARGPARPAVRRRPAAVAHRRQQVGRAAGAGQGPGPHLFCLAVLKNSLAQLSSAQLSSEEPGLIFLMICEEVVFVSQSELRYCDVSWGAPLVRT